MKKSTTWRVRAIGTRSETWGRGMLVWADRTFDEDPGSRTSDIEILLKMCEVFDFQIARLETIVSGPNELARRDVMKFGSEYVNADPEATYRRTIIDTREWITRPWTDPASAQRWHELSEKE